MYPHVLVYANSSPFSVGKSFRSLAPYREGGGIARLAGCRLVNDIAQNKEEQYYQLLALCGRQTKHAALVHGYCFNTATRITHLQM